VQALRGAVADAKAIRSGARPRVVVPRAVGDFLSR